MLRYRSVFWLVLSVFVVILALALSGCGGDQGGVSSSGRTPGERLKIVASFSILADVARNVAGDAADVESLMSLGANPHTYSPSAQDVLTLSAADVVFIVGANFEEGLSDVLAEAAGENLVVASECVPIRPVFSGVVAGDDDDGAGIHESMSNELCATHHEAANTVFGLDDNMHSGEYLGLLYELDCGDRAAGASEGEHIHAAGSCDSHVWVDPVNVALWTLMIRDELIERDPENADTYTANAGVYLTQLAATNAEVEAMLAGVPEERRTIVTNHLTLNYFAARYGLTLVGVVIPGGSTASEPSVGEVLDLIDTIREYDVPAIFAETTASEDLAEQIAEETGAKIVRLYTGSLSYRDEGADTYLNYTRFNASAIANALK